MRDFLVGQGVGSDNQCFICQGGAETILHALRDCPWAQLIWRKLGVQETNHGFWWLDLQDWLGLNGKMSKSVIDGHPPYKLLYSFNVWHIWKNRNNYVFNGKQPNPKLATKITNQAMELLYYYAASKASNGSINKLVRWEKPPRG